VEKGVSSYPNAASGDGFNWELLEAPDEATGPGRLDFQYWQANINPWDRYVLSVPGSLQFRLWPDGSGVENLYLAGDWVRSGLNAGCVEAAVIAGRMAARAITGAHMAISGDGNSADFPLPVSALPLLYLGKKLKDRVAAGAGTMNAYCATVLIDAGEVKKMLPGGLHLADPTSSQTHPIVLLFTHQRNVRPGFVPIGGVSYWEFVEIIPNVQRDDLDAPTGGPFSYMPYLFLDRMLPMLVGENLYGFNKRLARISSEGKDFDIRSTIGTIRAQFRDGGFPGEVSDFPEIKPVCLLLERPFISLSSTGTWIYSYFDFHLDEAEFRRAEGIIAIGEPFLPARKTERGSIYSSDGGQLPWFRLSTNWTLSMPLIAGRTGQNVLPQDLQSVMSAWATRLSGRLVRR
jgi:hypothetical protein